MRNAKALNLLAFFLLFGCSGGQQKNVFSKQISESNNINISISDLSGATDGVTYYICMSNHSDKICDLCNSFFVSYRPEFIKTITSEKSIYIIQRGGEISKFNSKTIIFSENSRAYNAYIKFDSKIMLGKYGRELN